MQLGRAGSRHFLVLLFLGVAGSLMLNGCGPEAVVFSSHPSRDQSVLALEFTDREAARGRDIYASPQSAAGVWRVRCARDTAAIVGTCVLKTQLTGGEDFVVSPADGFAAVVAASLAESTLQAETGPLAPPTCVGVSGRRRACLWIGEARRIADALREGQPLSLSIRAGAETLQRQLPSEGYAEAERSYPQELRAMRTWRDGEVIGGGAGGGSM
jgi:hypothetical protein